MDLYVIGGDKPPQKVGLAREANEELITLQAAGIGPLQLHRAYPLAPGWDQLAMRIALIPLTPYASNNGWFNVPPFIACIEADKAFRSTQVPKADTLPKPDYGYIMRMIRTTVFGCSQDVIAAICGCTGSRVSRWESGQLEPGMLEIHRLRSFAIAHGIPWDDSQLHQLSDVDVRLTA
jgi:hypothetical protein